MEEEKTGRRLTVFIGHRQADQAVADVLKATLETWGNGQLTIFESSDVREHPPRIGQNLTHLQKKAFAHANAIFLIYSVTDQDWFYCMWQCGLATDPRGQGTRIVVFQYARDIPASLRNQMQVTIEEKAIKEFTHAFHRDPAFFPSLSEAFAPEIDQEEIEAKSCDLLNKLRSIVPAQRHI